MRFLRLLSCNSHSPDLVYQSNLSRFWALRPGRFQTVMVTRRMATSRTSSGPRDPNTLSNYHDFVTRHISVNLDIDFGQKAFKGNVVLELDSLNDGDKQEIILDSSHVDVQQVTVNDKESKWKLDPPSEPYGSAMRVFLAKGVSRGTSIRLQVSYALSLCNIHWTLLTDRNQITLSTTEKCTALQWLTPAMTVNKKHPYMCMLSIFLLATRSTY